MRLTIRLACILSLAAAGLAAPAACHRGDSHIVQTDDHRIISNHDGHHLEIHMRGAVDFNDAGNWVASLPAGGVFTIEERDNGERRLEFRPGEGGPRVRYFVNGRERPLDDTGGRGRSGTSSGPCGRVASGAERRWPASAPQRGERRTGGHGPPAQRRRPPQLLPCATQGWVDDSTSEFTRVMEDVGRRVGSDVETRLVLIDASEHAGDGARLAALLRAALGIDSDVETRLVLTHVTGRHRLSEGAVRDAFFRAVAGLGSDVERRLVLSAVLDERLADGASRDAFFRAVSRFDSDVERRIVLSKLLRGDKPRPRSSPPSTPRGR